MKTVTILLLLLLLGSSSAFGELTREDLRSIIKEENTALEKRLKEYIDLKIDGVEKSLNARIDGVEKSLNARIDAVEKNLNDKIDGVEKNLSGKMRDIWLLVLALIGLITAAIAVPQIIIAYRGRGQKDLEQRQEDFQTEIRQLREQVEAMQNTISSLSN